MPSRRAATNGTGSLTNIAIFFVSTTNGVQEASLHRKLVNDPSPRIRPERCTRQMSHLTSIDSCSSSTPRHVMSIVLTWPPISPSRFRCDHPSRSPLTRHRVFTSTPALPEDTLWWALHRCSGIAFGQQHSTTDDDDPSGEIILHRRRDVLTSSV